MTTLPQFVVDVIERNKNETIFVVTAAVARSFWISMKFPIFANDLIQAIHEATGRSWTVIDGTIRAQTTNGNRTKNKRCTREQVRDRDMNLFYTVGVGVDRRLRKYNPKRDTSPVYFGDVWHGDKNRRSPKPKRGGNGGT
jgi:hypothetical protein